MSNSEEENSADQGADLGIDNEQLPDGLVPGEDNPLAEGLDDGETVDDLLDGGKTAEQSTDEGDAPDAEDSEDSGES
jgi:hypothetical protein